MARVGTDTQKRKDSGWSSTCEKLERSISKEQKKKQKKRKCCVNVHNIEPWHCRGREVFYSPSERQTCTDTFSWWVIVNASFIVICVNWPFNICPIKWVISLQWQFCELIRPLRQHEADRDRMDGVLQHQWAQDPLWVWPLTWRGDLRAFHPEKCYKCCYHTAP